MTTKKAAPERPRNSEDRMKVRTTMKPKVDLEVTTAEFLDLLAQGLIVTTTAKKEN